LACTKSKAPAGKHICADYSCVSETTNQDDAVKTRNSEHWILFQQLAFAFACHEPVHKVLTATAQVGKDCESPHARKASIEGSIITTTKQMLLEPCTHPATLLPYFTGSVSLQGADKCCLATTNGANISNTWAHSHSAAAFRYKGFRRM
jgi:hypothetical protein